MLAVKYCNMHIVVVGVFCRLITLSWKVITEKKNKLLGGSRHGWEFFSCSHITGGCPVDYRSQLHCVLQ